MDRYVDGDAAAFGEVHRLLAPRLYAALVRWTRDHHRAEDLLQQTFLHMHAARGAYVRSSDVVPWAFAIARRLLVDASRRQRKEVLFHTAEDEASARDSRVERFDVPESICATSEQKALAVAALERMCEAHREAYLLLHRDGLSVAQAADALRTTRMAVKLRAHRAYARLRAAIAEAADVGR
jgi:RNA polymerase sigma-70 factor (ECF subfamily)